MCTATASPLPADLQQALAEIEKLAEIKWAFTFTKQENQKTAIERFDPSAGHEKHWSLLSINGRKPNAAEILAYQRKRNGKISNIIDITEATLPGVLAFLIRRDSIQIAHDAEERSRYTFVPQVDFPLFKKPVAKLKGAFIFSKRHHMLETIEVRNPTVFNPVPFLEVNTFYGFARFERLQDSGELQLVAAELKVKGRRFLSAVNENTRIVYSDYMRVID